MKAVNGLRRPPSGLEAFVRSRPRERNWDSFRTSGGGNAYRELRAVLTDLQHGLCCYCENNLMREDRQVEHFHPKCDHQDPNTNHTTDYRNLMAACCGGTNPHWAKLDPSRYLGPAAENLSCGQSKRDQTDILDPRTLPPVPSVFRVAFDGRMEVDARACKETEIDPDMVERTIAVLGLNCTRLRRMRADMMRSLGKQFNDMDVDVLMAAARISLLPDPDDPKARLPRFFTTIRSFFGGAAELVLEEQPQDWI